VWLAAGAWSNLPDGGGKGAEAGYLSKKPLELTSAFSLAVVFCRDAGSDEFALGPSRPGRNLTAWLCSSGLAPVDPFIMGSRKPRENSLRWAFAAAGVVGRGSEQQFCKSADRVGARRPEDRETEP